MHSNDGATCPRRLATSAPVRFVTSTAALIETVLATPDLDDLLRRDAALRAEFARNGELCWIVLTFHRLMQAGVGPIELADEAAPGAINIHTSVGPATPAARSDLFSVAVQADFSRLLWAQLSIQQNARAGRASDPVMPLWPQPAIVPRGPGRSSLRRVAFLGKTGGNLAGNIAWWGQMLAPHGLEFFAPAAEQWHDYSAIDLTIGIRDFAGHSWDAKPPSKLVNAWIAGVPFIGGADSAFAQVGQEGVDHLVARTPEEALSAVLRLKDDPALYRSLVEAGRMAAQRYSTERLVHDWIDLLEGPVEQRYRQWRAHPQRERLRLAMLAVAHTSWTAAKAVGRRVIRRPLAA